MHALAELGITHAFGEIVGANARISSCPSGAAVHGVEHADRRDADPKLVGVIGMRYDRVQVEFRAARRPVRPRRMLLQAVQVRPARAGILADKQARRFDPEVDAPAPDGEAPAGSDRRLALGVGQPMT